MYSTLFSLDPPAPGNRLFDLLGRAIVIRDTYSLSRPLSGTILPVLPEPGPDLKLINPNLYPERAIECEDVDFLKGRTTDTKLVADISKVISTHFGHATAATTRATAVGFRRITMEQQRSNISMLLKDDRYKIPILDHLTKFPEYKLGVVVEIITLAEMKKNAEKNAGNEGGFRGRFPAEVVGAPGVDPTIEASHKSTRRGELKGLYKGEIIFACGYLELSIRQASTPHWFASLFGRKKMAPHIDDIIVSKTLVDPQTIILSLPERPIHGRIPILLGGSSEEQPDDDDAVETRFKIAEDDNLNFSLHRVPEGE